MLSILKNLKTFNIYICPQRKLHLKSKSLREVGIFKSDAIEISHLELPSLGKLNIHENTVELFRKIMADRETNGTEMHKNLLSVIYEGCPKISVLNNLKLPPELVKDRPEQKIWTRKVNKLLIKQYQTMLLHEDLPNTQTSHN